MFDLIIKNGRVVFSDAVQELDIAIKDGKIAALGSVETLGPSKEVIDVSGKYVFPGAIDTHAHLNDPGYNWRETFEFGTAAAAVGGYTTIVDMPLQNEPATTSAEILKRKIEHVGPKAYCDYGMWGGLVDYNFQDLEGLDKEGVLIFKSFIGPVSPDYRTLHYGQVKEALEIIAKFDARAGFHCEDYNIIKWEEKRLSDKKDITWRDFLNTRPLSAELIATKAVIDMSRETGCKTHICHVSHPDVAQAIMEAQLEGVPVTAETCTHYLIFTEDDVIEKGELFKCAPPLRSAEDRERLWEYVLNGTFSAIGSDHSPCELSEKDPAKHGILGAWGGISGIQSGMQVVFSEGVVKRGFCPTFIARAMAEDSAKAFGLWGKKGAIKVGFDADLVVLDPDKEWEITPESLLYLNKISAFVGVKGKGLPVKTFVRGKLVAENGDVIKEMKGTGEYLRRIREEA